VQLTNRGSGNYGHEVGLLIYPPTVSIILKAPAGKAINLDAPIDIKAKDETARTIFSAVAKALGASSFVDTEATAESLSSARTRHCARSSTPCAPRLAVPGPSTPGNRGSDCGWSVRSPEGESDLSGETVINVLCRHYNMTALRV
jgi:hypothetical protein